MVFPMEHQLRIQRPLVRFFSLLLFSAFIIAACNEGDKGPGNYQNVGRFNEKNLEDGKWQYLDSKSGQPIAEGRFNSGVRLGLWKYYSGEPVEINWQEYVNDSISLRTNIPAFVKLVEHDATLVKFIHQDTSKIFTLVIAKGYVSDSMDYETYRKEAYSDLASRHVIVTDTVSRILRLESGKSILYNNFLARSQEGQAYYFYNILGKSNQNEPIEVTIRCEPALENLAKKTFFSVIPNLFIHGERFLPLNQKIIEIE